MENKEVIEIIKSLLPEKVNTGGLGYGNFQPSKFIYLNFQSKNHKYIR